MIPISSAISGGLVWSKTPYKRGYELKREIVGSLQRTSFWSSEFQAESAYGSWKFRSHRLFPHWYGNCRFKFRHPNRHPQAELERRWNAGFLRRTDISAYFQRFLAASLDGAGGQRSTGFEDSLARKDSGVAEGVASVRRQADSAGNFRVAHYPTGFRGCCLGGSGSRGNNLRTLDFFNTLARLFGLLFFVVE